MKCRFCDAENPENAIFCVSCGKRIDGKHPCPACGAMVDEQFVFCPECGKRIDGKQVCSVCGTVHEGKFCPTCGHSDSAEPHDPEEDSRPIEKSLPSDSKERHRKLFFLLGNIGALCAVFFSLLFVFLIGFGATGSGLAASSSMQSTVTGQNIYYYFGDAYQDVETVLGTSHSDISGVATYLSVVPGTIVAAATLCAVIVLAVLSAVRFTSLCLGKSEKPLLPFACGTYFAFLGGAVAFLGTQYMSISYQNISSVSVSASVIPNGATIAGIVLGAVFLIVAIVFLSIRQGKKLFSQKQLPALICAAVGCVLLAVMLGFTGILSVGVSESSASAKSQAAFGFPMAMKRLGVQAVEHWTETAKEGSFVGYSVVLTVLSIAASSLIATQFCALFKPFSEKKQGISDLTLAIILAVIGILLLALSVPAAIDFAVAMFGETAEVDVSFAPSIVVLVFGVLNLVRSIVQFSFARSKHTAESTVS